MNVIFFQNVNELWKSRCNVNPFFILDTEDSLIQHLLNDQGEVISCRSFFYFIKIHENRNKRCLSVGGHQGDNLILDNLHSLLDLLADSHLCNFIDFIFIEFHSLFFEFSPNLFPVLVTANLDERNQMG